MIAVAILLVGIMFALGFIAFKLDDMHQPIKILFIGLIFVMMMMVSGAMIFMVGAESNPTQYTNIASSITNLYNITVWVFVMTIIWFFIQLLKQTITFLQGAMTGKHKKEKWQNI
jgi:hypothetical protein